MQYSLPDGLETGETAAKALSLSIRPRIADDKKLAGFHQVDATPPQSVHFYPQSGPLSCPNTALPLNTLYK